MTRKVYSICQNVLIPRKLLGIQPHTVDFLHKEISLWCSDNSCGNASTAVPVLKAGYPGSCLKLFVLCSLSPMLSVCKYSVANVYFLCGINT